MKESLLLVFANKQDLPGGLVPFLGYACCERALIGRSNVTGRGYGKAPALKTQGQDVVRGAELRNHRRGTV